MKSIEIIRVPSVQIVQIVPNVLNGLNRLNVLNPTHGKLTVDGHCVGGGFHRIMIQAGMAPLCREAL